MCMSFGPLLELVNYVTLFKKVIYWYQSFHEDPLTSMETFHCTKGTLKWKKCLYRLLKCSSHLASAL